jgi:hypothetical protein
MILITLPKQFKSQKPWDGSLPVTAVTEFLCLAMGITDFI